MHANVVMLDLTSEMIWALCFNLSWQANLCHESWQGNRKELHLQISRHAISQLLGILCNLGVQVDCGGMLEQLILVLNCLQDFRMTMPNADRHNPCKCLQDRHLVRRSNAA